MKLILKDSNAIEIDSTSRYNNIITTVSDYSELQALTAKLTNQNLSLVKFETNGIETGSYENMTLMEPNYHITQKADKITVVFGLRKLTEAENVEENVLTAVAFLADEQALSVKTLYPRWEDDPVGYSYDVNIARDCRRQYDGRLWKLAKSHAKQTDWYPGADPTLWVEIVEGHEGTLEDPIPVPDSVKTSGFEYEYGKYYLDGVDVYLAKREGKEDGEVEKLYFPPSELVGQYFEKVSSTEPESAE